MDNIRSLEQRTQHTRPGWHALFRWCREHRVTGAELIHFPLLVWFGVVLLLVREDAMRTSIVYQQMDELAPIKLWALLPIATAIVKGYSILTKNMRLQQISLALAASWWVLIAGFLLINGGYLVMASFVSIAASAYWRVADLAVADGGP